MIAMAADHNNSRIKRTQAVIQSLDVIRDRTKTYMK